MSEIVKAVTERIEILGDKMKERTITPKDAEMELESILKEMENLNREEESIAMGALIKLLMDLEQDRRRKRKERFDAIKEALGSSDTAKGILGILSALEGMNKQGNDSNNNENNTKCDGDCKNCKHGAKVGEERVSVGFNFNDLDEDEKEELRKIGDDEKTKRDIPVTVNQYIDVIEVMPQVRITKFDLSIILEKLKNDYKEKTVVSGIVTNKEDKIVGLHFGFLFERDIIVNLEKIELSEEEKKEFCESFIKKYVA